nr:hypothetical protein [Deltaproteobacteria bacterium]
MMHAQVAVGPVLRRAGEAEERGQLEVRVTVGGGNCEFSEPGRLGRG